MSFDFDVIPAGRVRHVKGGVGKFGWKAQTATLVEFMGEAFRDEIGITNPLAPTDLVSGCRASVQRPEADAVPPATVNPDWLRLTNTGQI